MASLAPVRPGRPFTGRTLRVFRALATTIVPDAERLDEAEWTALEVCVGKALADRPAAMQRQFLAFLRILDALPVARWGRTFRRLDAPRRERFLAAIEDAPLLLLRRGFWGLRTLVFMGYYTRPGAAAEIGYRADPRGWEARR